MHVTANGINDVESGAELVVDWSGIFYKHASQSIYILVYLSVIGEEKLEEKLEDIFKFVFVTYQ